LDWWYVIGIAFGLAMDAFAVAIAAGLTIRPITGAHVFRLAFHFGLFQFLMPIVGWLAGSTLAEHIDGYDHWVAFVLLSVVGGKMLLDARHKDESRSRADPTRGLTMVMLSVATSLDALAVGLSMAMLQVSIWGPSVVIGTVAAAFTTVGIVFGARLGPRWENWAEVLGGSVLLAIGAWTLWRHLTG
jgi:manganese efflux pump family protein